MYTDHYPMQSTTMYNKLTRAEFEDIQELFVNANRLSYEEDDKHHEQAKFTQCGCPGNPMGVEYKAELSRKTNKEGYTQSERRHCDIKIEFFFVIQQSSSTNWASTTWCQLRGWTSIQRCKCEGRKL